MAHKVKRGDFIIVTHESGEHVGTVIEVTDRVKISAPGFTDYIYQTLEEAEGNCVSAVEVIAELVKIKAKKALQKFI